MVEERSPQGRTLGTSLLFSLFLLLSGCGMVQTIAVDTTADILYEATGDIFREGNWKTLKEAIPGNLKMMEGMLYVEPENEELLVALTKGYAGQAFAIDETLALAEKYKDADKTPHKEQLLINYSKALTFGLRYLAENDVTYDKLKTNMSKEGGIVALLNDELGDDMIELEGVLFTAQSLGGLIMWQMDSFQMVAQLPIVKGMFDWVCSKKPDIHYGTCDIFYAAYDAARPKMLGGNPEKGKRVFLALLKKFPHHHLARTEYIRYYLIPMADEDGYKKQKKYLNRARAKFVKDALLWSPEGKVKDAYKDPAIRLFQAIGMKRIEIIQKYEEEFL